MWQTPRLKEPLDVFGETSGRSRYFKRDQERLPATDLDIFNEASGGFPALLVAINVDILYKKTSG